MLSQLLQEKDQLQREQEDRIKNLTKLLVTSSNLAPVKKVQIPQNEAVLLHDVLVLMDHFSAFEDAQTQGYLGWQDAWTGPTCLWCLIRSRLSRTFW